MFINGEGEPERVEIVANRSGTREYPIPRESIVWKHSLLLFVSQGRSEEMEKKEGKNRSIDRSNWRFSRLSKQDSKTATEQKKCIPWKFHTRPVNTATERCILFFPSGQIAQKNCLVSLFLFGFLFFYNRTWRNNGRILFIQFLPRIFHSILLRAILGLIT